MEQILQSKEDWVKSRSLGIGGSEIASILGLDPYRSPYSVWMDKTSGQSKSVENAYTRSGQKLEKVVVEYFVEETGFAIEPQNDQDFHHICHKEYDYMRGSRDRVYVKPNGERCILECKTTQSNVDKNDLPMTWFCQLQWYMGLYGVRIGAIAWLERGIRFDYKEIEFDEVFFNYLVSSVKMFWENYVLTNTEPPYMNANDVALKYPNHADNVVIEATDELFAVYNKLKEIREKVKDLEAQESILIDSFKTIMKDAEKAMYHGMTLATWKSGKSKLSFDADKFAQDHPDAIKPYMAEKQSVRRFLLK